MARVALPALRAGLLAVAALMTIATTAWSNLRITGVALERIRARTWDAKIVRITGPFGCVETSRPLIEPDGILCEPVESCDDQGNSKGDLSQRTIPWDEIDEVAVGHRHSDTGALIGAAAGFAGGIAVGTKRTDRDLGLAEVIRPLAIELVAIPFMLGGAAAGWLIGRNVETWKTCYHRSQASAPLTSESRARLTADSIATR